MFPNQTSGDADELGNDGPQLIVRMTTADDGRRQCTIHPESATERRTTTRWITADEDSFVELETIH